MLAFVSSFDQELDLMAAMVIAIVTFVLEVFLLNQPRMDLELIPVIIVDLAAFKEYQNCFRPK